MKRERGNQGFTMAELIAVIAIIAVIGALGIFGAAQYLRTMYQVEMDGTAKEVFIAAQNHLSIADSMGMLKGKADKGTSTGEDGIYYYAIGPEDSRLDWKNDTAKSSVFYQMLPYNSIDETVRAEGTYIIRYDLNTARVLDVFFAEDVPQGMFVRFPLGRAFTASDYSVLYPGGTGDSDEAHQLRWHYGDNDAVVGYYGGEDAGTISGDVEPPKVRVTNAEKLLVEVYGPSYIKEGNTEVSLELVLTGKTSGKSTTPIPINPASTPNELLGTGLNENNVQVPMYIACLDSVTTSGERFADRFSSYGLIPGEDVEIRVFASSMTGLMHVSQSSIVTTNSLFESVGNTYSEDSSHTVLHSTAYISNIRHLQNLAQGVSGYNHETLNNAKPQSATVDPGPIHAEQTVDLSWSDFRTKVVALDNRLTKNRSTPGDPEKVRIYNASKIPTNEGTYLPVNPAFAIHYDGKSHRVSDVKVDASAEAGNAANGPAGMFGAVGTGAEIKNLELINFTIDSTAGDAGALAGHLEGVTVSGVLARNEGDETNLHVNGSGDTGGLIGSLAGGTVDRCAAAVYVTSSGSSAGGLVGSSTAPITNSYSGGHTTNGAYVAGAGNCNVQAGGGTAGGLVGTTSANISNCYSTCSASGSTAGGLVGSATGGTIGNCYALGLVEGDTKGAFAGSVSGLGNNNYYLKIINGNGVSPVSGGDANVTAIDADTVTFNAFAPLSAPANPYDGTLATNYSIDGTVYYMYKSIYQLNSDSVDKAANDDFKVHMTTHFGDWPSPETLVVNR